VRRADPRLQSVRYLTRCLPRLRIDRGQELLRTPAREWNLAAIANECGVADQSHFSRQFKRVVAVTPGENLA